MKRFYRDVAVAAAGDGYQVLLDDRPVRTQGGASQQVPTARLAEALAAEWASQAEEIDPRAFRLRDHADYAIDIVAADRAASIARLLGFGETDTLCYRGEPGDPLFRRQQDCWEPLMQAIEVREAVRFERVSGIVHRAQPTATLARLEQRLERLGPFELAALEAIVSLSASLCIGLAALEPGADAGELFAAAELEEAWQAELWGRDAEAEARRACRAADFATAIAFLGLVDEAR